MRLNSVSSIGVLPFIEGSLGDGTSGLVASSRVDRMMKSTLRASLLKVVTRTAVDLRHLAAVALWVLMNINDRGMTMPRHPPLSIKRNAVPLRGLVTLVYLYWYPVSSLRDRLNAACGQSLNSVVFLVILGPSLAFYSSYVYSFPFPPERTEFHGFTVFLVLGTSFFWVVVAPLHHWMLLYCLSACLEHNDWHHWIPLIVLLGVLLALAMATG